MKKFLKLFACIMALTMTLATFTACKEPKENILWVGNTASTTGVYAPIGEPFNLGIRAAFEAWNADRTGDQFKIKLKHYDDGGVAGTSATLTEKLINEDEVFAIVGNFGTPQIAANLDVIKDAQVPMVYAASGSSILLNENATTVGERGIFPVQPLSHTEGKMLYLRATAPATYDPTTYAMTGGLGGTKIGVVSDTSSIEMLAGIQSAAGSNWANVSNQTISESNFSTVAAALKNANCDVVIVCVVGTNFTSMLKALADVDHPCKIITTYNNASAAVFNSNNILNTTYEAVFDKLTIYAQGWLDISSLTYVYDSDADADTPLAQAYKAFYESLSLPYAGVPLFSESYWKVAEDIFNYALSQGRSDALAMSSDSYALAGYIAGDMFIQAIDALEAAGKKITKENFLEIMETNTFNVAMGGQIEFKDGVRAGVEMFSLTQIYDTSKLPVGATSYRAAAATTVQSLMSLDQFQAMLTPAA